MLQNPGFRSRVLCIDDTLHRTSTAAGRRIKAIVEALRARGGEVIESVGHDDGEAALASDSAIHCLLLDWSLGEDDEASRAAATALLRRLRQRDANLPVFLLVDRHLPMTVEAATFADELIWTLEDSPEFIARRVEAAVQRYFHQLLPPFTRALVNYKRDAEYSWAAPGHQGGVAFRRSPIGRIFHDVYGETLFRTDMGIERGALGSLLSHSGPIGDSEQYAARVFGSDRTYSVLNGTSASNRTVMSACIGEHQIAVCDRNCHKSIEQGLAITGGIPVFLLAGRNRYGVIGPIHPEQMTPEAIAALIADNPLAAAAVCKQPVYGAVTNSTYDGICYDAQTTEALLGKSIDRLHFDEAWYGHARFNPMYRGRYAMRGDAGSHDQHGPTVYATHSTHKLLAALSQTSFIHVRDGRGAIEHGRFNEAYRSQASTSPLYSLIASNEVAAAMVAGTAGEALTQDVIDEAIACRQAVAQVHHELGAKGEWFFSPWNAPQVTDPASGRRYAFVDAPPELLTHEPSCWVLHPGETWHGFDDVPDGWCLLDPIRLALVAPGMQDDGQLADHGVPGDLVTAYLMQHGIVPSRTTPHMVLFLFSMGVTKSKWGTLITRLLDFKHDYDVNKPLAEVLPRLSAAAPKRYAGLGLKDLGDAMWAELRRGRIGYWEAQAYAQLPRPVCTPRAAFQQLMAGAAELVHLDQLAGRTTAVGVIPYPPGIPVVMPGESLGPADGPWIRYLQVLQDWGQAFPGFAKEVEGTIETDGLYRIYCLKP